MILIRNRASGERQAVEMADGYDVAEWEVLGEVPAGVDPMLATIEGGAIVNDAAVLEAALHAAIDDAAELARQRHFPTRPGQEATYTRKQGEAVAYDPAADPALFPLLSAEAGARGIGMAELAGLVIEAAAARVMGHAGIEAARIGAKRAVSAASGPDAMRAAAEVDWEAVLAA